MKNNFLVTGGCKNGKSSLAQSMAFEKAKALGISPVYFATMISHDEEDDERIRKHREDRKNLGFETVECGKNISEAAEKIGGRVVLFDSLTALVQNEMFEGRKNLESLLGEEEKILAKLKSDLGNLIQKAESVIFVSDSIFSDGKVYDKFTEMYRRILAETENFLAEKCGVIEMVSGIRKEGGVMKDMERETENNSEFRIPKYALVVGGAYQGKTAFAKEKFFLSDDEISVCTDDRLPDFSRKCLVHYENYAAYCIRNNLLPRTDFESEGENVKIIICDDIFCGVVPVDAFQRKLREVTGIALQKIAEKSGVYRVFCGSGERIK
ncbi:MAG: bifunctional adenosylcobinamide kinase/adenosylcobinamide-phosphate guanylyltransferase [Treponema sp.]|nr:bifunctional adenosylcobinamide kinase/adenosylcobinamide-phosphate guanylyltransferase [Treponema sp.]